MKHKHAELIHAWADGAIIEMKMAVSGKWVETSCPQFYLDSEYRIKPEPKPDKVLYIKSYYSKYKYFETQQWLEPHPNADFKLIFDGETGKLKSAEVLK